MPTPHIYDTCIGTILKLLPQEPVTRACALQVCHHRVGIEETFGDWEGHGVDREAPHLRRIGRLSLLVFSWHSGTSGWWPVGHRR